MVTRCATPSPESRKVIVDLDSIELPHSHEYDVGILDSGIYVAYDQSVGGIRTADRD